MSNGNAYKFTVFTATLNRGRLLGNVYESLKTQSFRDFEWVIVDDGSTDNTRELATGWIKEDPFPISYFWQENSGKHTAFNLGVSKAKGGLFLPIDSDDYCKPDALKKFNSYWENIPLRDRSFFSGVFCNCVDKQGNIIGNELPEGIVDSNFIDIRYMFGVRGDKWGFLRTEILRQFPFPVINNEKFLTEALVWNRISLRYKTRFINENMLVANYQNNGLSSQSLALRIKNPLGAILYYREFLFLSVPLRWKVRNLLNYTRFSFHAGIKLPLQVEGLTKFDLRFLFLLLLLPGYIIFKIDEQQA